MIYVLNKLSPPNFIKNFIRLLLELDSIERNWTKKIMKKSQVYTFLHSLAEKFEPIPQLGKLIPSLSTITLYEKNKKEETII